MPAAGGSGRSARARTRCVVSLPVPAGPRPSAARWPLRSPSRCGAWRRSRWRRRSGGLPRRARSRTPRSRSRGTGCRRVACRGPCGACRTRRAGPLAASRTAWCPRRSACAATRRCPLPDRWPARRSSTPWPQPASPQCGARLPRHPPPAGRGRALPVRPQPTRDRTGRVRPVRAQRRPSRCHRQDPGLQRRTAPERRAPPPPCPGSPPGARSPRAEARARRHRACPRRRARPRRRACPRPQACPCRRTCPPRRVRLRRQARRRAEQHPSRTRPSPGRPLPSPGGAPPRPARASPPRWAVRMPSAMRRPRPTRWRRPNRPERAGSAPCGELQSRRTSCARSPHRRSRHHLSGARGTDGSGRARCAASSADQTCCVRPFPRIHPPCRLPPRNDQIRGAFLV